MASWSEISVDLGEPIGNTGIFIIRFNFVTSICVFCFGDWEHLLILAGCIIVRYLVRMFVVSDFCVVLLSDQSLSTFNHVIWALGNESVKNSERSLQKSIRCNLLQCGPSANECPLHDPFTDQHAGQFACIRRMCRFLQHSFLLPVVVSQSATQVLTPSFLLLVRLHRSSHFRPIGPTIKHPQCQELGVLNCEFACGTKG